MFGLAGGLGALAWGKAGMGAIARGSIWASRNFDKAALGAIGISGALGLVRKDRSMLGSATRTAGYGALGMGIGAVGNAARSIMQPGTLWTGVRSAAGFRGAVVGGLVGMGYGLLKAGLGSNKAVNPIRGL